jgi:hypothetical protein
LTYLSGSANCHSSLSMDTPMTPIEIDDVEISSVSSMPIDGRGGGGQPPLPKKRRNVTNKSAA